MPSYLERYLDGEREQVWNELIALGDQVRQEPLYSDARAVARETMQRARRNVETLYQRLQSIGYQFQCERPRSAQNPLEGLRDQLAGNPLMQSAFGDMLGRLDTMQQQMLDLLGQGSRDASGKPAAPPTYRGFNPPPADIAQQLDEFERALGPLPLSVRAWCEIVGTVDFVGDHPGLASYTREGGGQIDLGGLMRGIAVQNPDMFNAVKDSHEADVQAYLEETARNTPFSASAMMSMYRLMRQEMDAPQADAPANPPPEEEIWWASDPLAFDFHLDAEEAQWEMENEEYDGLEPGQYGLVVAPDIHHKANVSGSTYDIILPDPRADTLLHGADLHFVAYLRRSFAWGGFPGLEHYDRRDDRLIAFLKDGLEPI